MSIASSVPDTTNGRTAIFKPLMQGGFAVLSVLMLAVLCWRMQVSDKQLYDLMQLQTATNSVIQENTGAIKDLSRVVMDKL